MRYQIKRPIHRIRYHDLMHDSIDRDYLIVKCNGHERGIRLERLIDCSLRSFETSYPAGDVNYRQVLTGNI